MLIEAPDFDVGDNVELMALQGDWDLEPRHSHLGARWVIRDQDRPRARESCLGFIERFRNSTAKLALIPELTIPRENVDEIVASIRGMQRSVLLLGGIEGLTRDEYSSLLDAHGGVAQPLIQGAGGNYVNALLVVLKTPTSFHVFTRAKRIPSLAENALGPVMGRGAGPFFKIALGQRPVTVVPLVCSEFVWADQLWTLLGSEVPGDIDLVPVLQLNSDPTYGHIGPQLYRGFTSAATKNTRFVFANQAIGANSDGASYVVVPPTSPAAPAFDQGHNELWAIPGGTANKGFRIPDLTGCSWRARIFLSNAPTTALQNPVCEGAVVEVLDPKAAALSGLVIGLMRSAAKIVHRDGQQRIDTFARGSILRAVDQKDTAFILRNVSSTSAGGAFYLLQNATPIFWHSVQSMVNEAIEGMALLAAANDDVELETIATGNCRVGNASVRVLFAPNVDESLSKLLDVHDGLSGATPPSGIVLVAVATGSSNPDAKKLGDIFNADQITSRSPDLTDIPERVEGASVSIRWRDTDFRSVVDLRFNWGLTTLELARARLAKVFPKVYEQ